MVLNRFNEVVQRAQAGEAQAQEELLRLLRPYLEQLARGLAATPRASRSSSDLVSKSNIHCGSFQGTPLGGDVGEVLENRGNQKEEEMKNGLGTAPDRFVRRSRKGLWDSVKDIPPDRIRRLFGFVELAPVAG